MLRELEIEPGMPERRHPLAEFANGGVDLSGTCIHQTLKSFYLIDIYRLLCGASLNTFLPSTFITNAKALPICSSIPTIAGGHSVGSLPITVRPPSCRRICAPGRNQRRVACIGPKHRLFSQLSELKALLQKLTFSEV